MSLLSLTVSAATFTAALDRSTVAIGESAVLSLTFEGSQPKSSPSLPNIPNLQITGQGTSQSYSFDNGVSSSTVTHTYALTPLQPGDYTIPTLGAIVDGKTLTTRPLHLKATAPLPPPTDLGEAAAQPAFMRLVLPKKEGCVGEPLVATLELYFQNGVQNYANFQITSLPTDGFNMGAKVQGQNRRAQVGNAICTVVPFSIVLTPVKTGPLSLGPVTASVVVVQPARNWQEQMFGGAQTQVAMAARAETIQIISPPRENAPANFNGAVGSYTLTVTAGPTNVAVGDPITVRVQISGSGALDSLALPEQPAWHDFKMYPPTSKVETADPLGIQGVKTFEQLIVPQSTDIRELPPISFSYFDTDKKTYRTLTQPAIRLTVRPGGANVVPTIAASNRAQENPPPAQDIVSIKQRTGKLEPLSKPLLEQPWFLTLQSVPALAFLGSVVWRKRTDSMANNPRLRRQRKVAQVLRHGLNDLRKFAAEKNSDAFFATLFRLLQEQIGECLDVPASAITEAVIEEHLKPRGVPVPMLTELHELFQLNNLARYTPIKSSQELAAMIPKVEAVLGELQKIRV